VADYAPAYGRPQDVTFTADATITGGQLLYFSAADRVSPTTGPTAAFAGIAGHDATPGAPVTVLAGSGVVHETPTAAQLNAPAQPVPTTAAAGGTVADGTYKVAVSYVTASGETTASTQGTIVTAGGGTSTITVPSPSAQPGATGWFAYVSQAGGSTLTRQQAPGAPTNIGTGLTLTAPPTSGGAQPPAGNTTGITPGELVSAAASGQIAGTTAAGMDIGVAIRASPAAGGLVRWKTTRG
jgi:hypothetical protein